MGWARKENVTLTTQLTKQIMRFPKFSEWIVITDIKDKKMKLKCVVLEKEEWLTSHGIVKLCSTRTNISIINDSIIVYGLKHL